MKERAKNGDVIKVQRYWGIYAHYGVYVEQGPCVTVIHYVETSGPGDSRGEVRETNLKKFLDGAEDYTVHHFSGPTFSGEETVRRARSKLGEGGYSVVWKNCEHFAAWCKTGEEKSSQVRGWATIAGLAFLALVALPFALAGSRSAESKREDDEIDLDL